MVAPQKRDRIKTSDSVRSDGATRVMELVRALNKSYEDTDFTVAESPVTRSIFTDFGYNSIQGYIICDGPGEITFEFTRDGTIFGEPVTIKNGELFNLKGLDVHSIKITHTGTDSSYRIFQI